MQNGVETLSRMYTHTSPVSGDYIFAALWEYRTIGQSAWHSGGLSTDLDGNSPRGYLDYMEYQLTMYLYNDTSRTGTNIINTGVDWSLYMNDILATSTTVSY